MTATTSDRMIHIMFQGQSYDVEQSILDVGDASTDQQIKQAAADHFNVPVEKLRNYAVDRNPETGNITIRPQASFG